MESQSKIYNAKVMHGYNEKNLEQDPGVDKPLSFLWKKDRYITSKSEKYLSVIKNKSFQQNTYDINKP